MFLAGGGAETPPGMAWHDYELAARAADQLRTEVFCYVAGALLRRDGIDQGVGKIAGLLLSELAARAGLANRLVTTLSFTSDQESLDRMINLVRLRFPGAGVWDLPVIAHEFGHYLMRECPSVRNDGQRPFINLVRDLARADDGCVGADAEQHVEELFADVCASYALGPAYPLACAGLRVPYLELDAETPSHPAWRYRITAMIKTLRWLAAQPGAHGSVIDKRVQPLSDALSEGREAGIGTAADTNRLKYQVGRMTLELKRHAGGLRYEMGDAADLIAAELARPGGAARLPKDCTVVHVLDGAWRWRLDHPDKNSEKDLAAASATVVELCEQVRRGREGDSDAV